MFGRRKTDTAGPIPAFWQWWGQAKERVAAAIAEGTVADLADEISEHVHAVSPSVDWELTPGKTAQHALIVSSVGDAKLRAVVGRWLAAAPAADEAWEYYGARQPDPNVVTARLQFDGHEIDLADLRFGARVDDDHAHFEVEVFHPAFAELDEGNRVRISFMSLDWILGEERVETWVGPIDAALTEPLGAVDAPRLVAMIDEHAARYREPQWAMLQGTKKGRAPLMAMVQRPLRSIRWPRFDTHVAVRLRYADRGNGFPTDASLDQMRAAEDELTALIGADGDLLAHETADGVRTLHYYVDSASGAVEALKKRATTLKGRSADTYDPSLEQIRHLA